MKLFINITILQKKTKPKTLNINENVQKLRKGHDALSINKLVQEQFNIKTLEQANRL